MKEPEDEIELVGALIRTGYGISDLAAAASVTDIDYKYEWVPASAFDRIHYASVSPHLYVIHVRDDWYRFTVNASRTLSRPTSLREICTNAISREMSWTLGNPCCPSQLCHLGSSVKDNEAICKALPASVLDTIKQQLALFDI
jgi:hypothetical protein